jgi:hypothetical protein
MWKALDQKKELSSGSSHEQMKFSVGRQVLLSEMSFGKGTFFLLPAQTTEASKHREQLKLVNESDSAKAEIKMTWKSPLFSEIPFLSQTRLTRSHG